MDKILLLIIFLGSGLFTLSAQNLTVSLYTSGFNRPVDISNAGDGRLFITEQSGRIYIIDESGNKLAQPFLDISTRVNDGQNEQGLLGLVFHPDYAQNGYFYVNYTGGTSDGETRISRFNVDPNDANKADKNSEQILFTVTQPEWNHNGGDLSFGPDGFLYIGLGDGGSGGDPWGNGQDKSVLLGKMLRIDVDNGNPYLIPATNPFVDEPAARGEIWAYGLRNPWRFSFDRETGDLWIADVGQNAREEIDFQPASSTGGENYGWNCREGDIAYGNPSNDCNPNDTYVEPVESYKVSNQCNSVTGGFVYRGCTYPDLYGKYVYADYCHGIIWTLESDGSGGWSNTKVFESSSYAISTFGEGVNGELYMARLDGQVYKIGMGNAQAAPDIAVNGTELSVPAGLTAYQWLLNGSPINGAVTNTYTATESGEYAVQVTYASGCEFTSSTVLLSVGIKELSWLDAVSLSPNPFSAELWLNIQLPVSKALTISVFDVEGKEVYRSEMDSASQFKMQLNLGHLASGIYLVSLQSDEGQWAQKVLKE